VEAIANAEQLAFPDIKESLILHQELGTNILTELLTGRDQDSLFLI